MEPLTFKRGPALVWPRQQGCDELNIRPVAVAECHCSCRASPSSPPLVIDHLNRSTSSVLAATSRFRVPCVAYHPCPSNRIPHALSYKSPRSRLDCLRSALR